MLRADIVRRLLESEVARELIAETYTTLLISSKRNPKNRRTAPAVPYSRSLSNSLTALSSVRPPRTAAWVAMLLIVPGDLKRPRASTRAPARLNPRPAIPNQSLALAITATGNQSVRTQDAFGC